MNLMWLFPYKGYKTNKIRKTHKTKEIILWLSHLTADLRHIDNKNLKQENIISKMFEPWHLQPFDHFSRN